MHGWRELADDVARVHASLPPGERHACAFAPNYGEASAIAVFSDVRAISGHNSYYLWGPEGCTADVLIVVGVSRENLDASFELVERVATHHCRDCMPYEDDLPIWVVRRPRAPLSRLWPGARSYI
jgi:hypothetical protein